MAASSLRSDRLRLAAIVAIGVVLRAIYLRNVGHTPFFQPLSPLRDDGLFDLRGLEIAQGHWLGGPSWVAYANFLYPYFLGAVYAVAGHSVSAARLIQTSLGSLTPIPVYFLAREAFSGRRVPLIAAALSAVYVPFIFFENLLLGESLALFFGLVSLCLLIRALKKNEGVNASAFGAGALTGVAALLRANLLIVAALTAVYLASTTAFRNKNRRAGAAAAGLFLAGVALGVAPATLRNAILNRDFNLVSASGGYALYMGNSAPGDGAYPNAELGGSMKEMLARQGAVAEEAAGRPLKPSEVSRYWLGRTFALAWSDPSRTAGRLLAKAGWFFNGYEFPDVLNMYFVSQFVPVLSLGRLEFGLAAVLALVGAAFGLRKASPAARLLFVWTGAYAASVVLFFVNARYRVGVVPVLLVFAASALERVRAAAKSRDGAALAKLGGAAALAALLVFRPAPIVGYSNGYDSLGNYYADHGRWNDARLCYLAAIDADPAHPAPYHNLSLAYLNLGDAERSRQLEEKYARLVGVQGP
jgi:4-amino-4-deoxy-L-arabinose transferase-like glycosyltransferase